MGICIVCRGEVSWNVIKDDFSELLEQVDYYGPDSLTENEQMIYEGRCCSLSCFSELD